MYIRKIYLDNVKQTKIFATQLAKYLAQEDVVAFSGNLGVGKTSLIKYLVEAMASKDIEVTSPTFNMVHIYELDAIKVWHFDLYRIKNAIEVYELGIEEAFVNGISLIEWPEIVKSILPVDMLEIKMFFGKRDDERIIHLSGVAKWIAEFKDRIEE